MNKYLICEHGESLKNFPKLIKEEHSKIVLVSGHKSILSKNKFLDEKFILEDNSMKHFNDQFVANKEIISKLHGWVIWGNDEIMRKVATSNLPLSVKLQILPTKKKTGLQLLGSKIGLANISNKIKINTPKTVVAKNIADLKNQSSIFTPPFIIKAEKYAGGAFVRKISTLNEKKELHIPNEWFPVVIQEFIDGSLIAVDAFFKQGTLIAWMYSSIEGTMGDFGASYLRTFRTPTERDFEFDLMRLGKECGLEGMFNCSFILKKNQHYLIEADARPNSWHFLYSHFKIPILEIMSEKIPMPTTPYIANLKNSEIELIDLDRAIPYAALKRNHKLIFYSLMRIRHSTQWLAGKRIKILNTLVYSFFISIVTVLPEKTQNTIKNFKSTKLLVGFIFRR